MRVVLASASTARTRLLADAGVAHIIRVSNVDEEAVVAAEGWTSAADVAGGLARAKARDVAATATAGDLVIGCDSVFDIGGEIHGKPADEREAFTRWQLMRGASGVLYTGHHVIDTVTGREVNRVVPSTVYFADPSDEELHAYISTGEPLRVAGGVTIDSLGAPFVANIVGDHSNVMGLSVPTMRLLLLELGIAWPTLWALASTHQSPTGSLDSR